MKNLPLKNIFIPSKVSSKKIMIILHGRGDSAKGFTWLPPYLNFDDMNYLLLYAPYDYFGGYSWYDLDPNQLPGIKHSSTILAEVFDTIFEKDFNIEESFLFGFSQGSLLTFEFGARYKSAMAGYISVSGYIYDPKLLLSEMNPKLKDASWLCTHGTQDEVLSYEFSKTQIELLQENGFKITFKSYNKTHTIIEEELDMIKSWINDRL